MHLKPCGKASCNGGKAGCKDDTHYQSQKYLGRCRQSREIKNMSEHGTGVDSLMHDNGSCYHAHTNHTSDGQVRTCKKDQARNAQGQEHSGRCLLQDIQHIVVGQKLNALNRRRDGAQGNEDNHNCNVQSVL